ncbi:putative rrp44-like exonuclease [Yasminevirus sp. GU-2018]|uniref:Putative rrp44-like exonuclease n=1 Tax=Yasminevirus sp. GU-2018 TaxID=2420051 RepID=A0A5K0U8K4_9VIRU|nr:putative rrp44-like exonuclease [Yasminevirus sp. GU-2018]
MQIYYGRRYTDFFSDNVHDTDLDTSVLDPSVEGLESVDDTDQTTSSSGGLNKLAKLYSLDTSDTLHLTTIPGVLRLSSKNFKTTTKRGFIMKEFNDMFNLFPAFMVRTDKIKDYTDKYVVVKVTQNLDPLTGVKSLYGTIERYIGDVGDVKTEQTLCQVISTCHWSRKIERNLQASNSLARDDLTPERSDLSSNKSMYTVSVDPPGSKDIDDAISVEIVDSHNVIVGVHIADPTSYVIEGSELDLEISKRAESVYLSDVTYHMFPESLSTDLFSLREKRVSRTFSVMVHLTKTDRWNITTSSVTKTLVRIDENTTYDAYQTTVDTSNTDDVFPVNSKKLMYEIGRDLYVDMLDSGRQTEYSSKRMVELFMVLANCIVAEKAVELASDLTSGTTDGQPKKVPIIVRSQGVSDYVLSDTEKIQAKELTTKDQALLVEHTQLRAQSAELRYYNPKSTMNSHATLKKSLYTHFTSPIRRYSDILFHRTLYNLLTRNSTFSLNIMIDGDSFGVGEMFVMNHYKKYYRNVSNLEKHILLTHDVIENLGYYPSDRIIKLQGVILDINTVNTDSKKALTNTKIVLKIKCTSVVQSDETEAKIDPQLLQRLTKRLCNTVHTVTYVPGVSGDDVSTSSTPEFRLFDEITYKMCFLQRDVRKVRTYL